MAFPSQGYSPPLLGAAGTVGNLKRSKTSYLLLSMLLFIDLELANRESNVNWSCFNAKLTIVDLRWSRDRVAPV